MVSGTAPAPTGLRVGRFSGGAGAATVAAAVVGAVVGALPPLIALLAVLAAPAIAAAALIPRFALFLVMLSIPFSSWTRVSIGKFDITATDVLVAILALAWSLHGLRERRLILRGGPILATALVLLTAALLSTITAADLPSAAKEVAKLAEMIVVATYVASTFTSPGEVRAPLLVLVVAATAEALIGLGQFVTGRGPDNFAIGSFMRAYGDFAQPNALAGYLGMVLPLGAALAWMRSPLRMPMLAATLVIAAALAATLSRGAWIGVALGLALMALVWSRATRRALIGAGLGALLVIGLAVAGVIPPIASERITILFEYFTPFDVRSVEPDPTNFSLVERMAHWQAGLEMGLDHPVVGVGPGNYEEAYPSYFIEPWAEPLGHAHNYYVNIFAEMGVVGLAAFLAFIAAIFVRIIQGIRRVGRGDDISRAALVGALGAAVAFSVHNTFDNMFVHGIGVQFGFILGLVEFTASRPAEAPFDVESRS